jgi:hypothetical protein
MNLTVGVRRFDLILLLHTILLYNVRSYHFEADASDGAGEIKAIILIRSLLYNAHSDRLKSSSHILVNVVGSSGQIRFEKNSVVVLREAFKVLATQVMGDYCTVSWC